jgi:hypothetical protein
MIQITHKFKKVFGTNNSYMNIKQGKMRIKKPEVWEYQKEWAHIGISIRSELKNFDPNRHYISLTVQWFNPKFFTQKGNVSLTAGDTDGVIKFIKDGLFTGIGINDVYVKRESITQLPTKSEEKSHVVSVLISIERLDLLLPIAFDD